MFGRRRDQPESFRIAGSPDELRFYRLEPGGHLVGTNTIATMVGRKWVANVAFETPVGQGQAYLAQSDFLRFVLLPSTRRRPC